MSPFQAAILGAIQGLTEFLPISSSAHLFVVPTLLGWRYEGMAFDVALHVGTLLALLFAYARDWRDLAAGLVASDEIARTRAWSLFARLAVASVPAAAAGLLFKDFIEASLRSLPLQAAMLALFGGLLWAVDRFRPAGHDDDAPGWGPCLVMGCAQALALIPGVSRSGVTMTAARATGLSRVSSARFSFLLATPITLGAALLEMRHLPRELPLSTLAIGVLTAAFVGVLAIRGLLRFLARAGFGAFFVYRLALAAWILWSLRSGQAPSS
jgi:undecaprenyl-diphosphatase